MPRGKGSPGTGSWGGPGSGSSRGASEWSGSSGKAQVGGSGSWGGKGHGDSKGASDWGSTKTDTADGITTAHPGASKSLAGLPRSLEKYRA